MSKKFVTTMLMIGLILLSSAGMAQTEKPKIAPICKQCHIPDEKILRGLLGGVSMKAETVQVQVGPAVWLVKFDDQTKAVGAEAISKIKKDHEISVAFTEKDGKLYAVSIGVKPPAKLPDEKMIKTDALAKLIAEKADMVVVDSRPGARYHEGHVPGSISIYDADLDKNVEKLPKKKDTLLIFYCGGVTALPEDLARTRPVMARKEGQACGYAFSDLSSSYLFA